MRSTNYQFGIRHQTQDKMQGLIIFAALLASAIGAPLSLGYNAYVPLSKSTFSSSSQVVNHGGAHIVHAPVVAHEVEYHLPLAKSTVTKSSQIVDHGSTIVAHAPVAHAVVAPVSHAYVSHSPVYSVSSPVVYKSEDSAISHQSSSTHESYNSFPFYAFH